MSRCSGAMCLMLHVKHWSSWPCNRFHSAANYFWQDYPSLTFYRWSRNIFQRTWYHKSRGGGASWASISERWLGEAPEQQMISRENFYCRYFFLTNYSITKKSTLKKGCLNRAQKVGGFYVPLLFFCRWLIRLSRVTKRQRSTFNVQRWCGFFLWGAEAASVWKVKR